MINEKDMEDYVDQTTAAKMLNITQGRISQLCSQGRFQGAMKIGWSWIIPKKAIQDFQPLRRGPKPKPSQNEVDQEFLANALSQANSLKEDDIHDKQ